MTVSLSRWNPSPLRPRWLPVKGLGGGGGPGECSSSSHSRVNYVTDPLSPSPTFLVKIKGDVDFCLLCPGGVIPWMDLLDLVSEDAV